MVSGQWENLATPGLFFFFFLKEILEFLMKKVK